MIWFIEFVDDDDLKSFSVWALSEQFPCVPAIGISYVWVAAETKQIIKATATT